MTNETNTTTWTGHEFKHLVSEYVATLEGVVGNHVLKDHARVAKLVILDLLTLFPSETNIRPEIHKTFHAKIAHTVERSPIPAFGKLVSALRSLTAGCLYDEDIRVKFYVAQKEILKWPSVKGFNAENIMSLVRSLEEARRV